MLVLTINKKPYIESPMTPPLLILSDHERPKSKLLGFKSLIFRKGAKVGPMSLLTINRKPYMASPMTPSLLILSDLEASKSRPLDFKALYLVKEPS